MIAMGEHPPERASWKAAGLNRRSVLRWGGAVGLLTAVAACSTEPSAKPESPSTTGTAEATPPSANSLPAPSGGASPTPTSESAVLLCREAWGALPPRPGGVPQFPNKMTIHHTAVVLGDNSNAPGRLRQHQHYHQDSKGWIDIAYHLGVDRNGNIYELRKPELVGDTATSYDPTGHFLVVCEGDFDVEAVSEAQLHSAAVAFAWAAQQFGIPTETLAGHRDVSHDTACPGAALYAHLTSGDLRQRVDDLIAAGRVDLVNLCGPEASAVVAEIEAGQR